MKFKNLIIIIALIFVYSCSGAKDALQGKKRSEQSDEFLVEKKNPLELPPDFGDLPVPLEQGEEENIQANNEVKVYPNPTRKQVYLTTTQNLEIEKVTVYNLQGKSLLNFDKDLETLSVEDLSTGIYLMKIETNRGVINKRLIKK